MEASALKFDWQSMTIIDLWLFQAYKGLKKIYFFYYSNPKSALSA